MAAEPPAPAPAHTVPSGGLADPFPVEPLRRPPDAEVVLPGSKSLTNRALVCALLAEGPSLLTSALASDDTEAMGAIATALGARVTPSRPPGNAGIGHEPADTTDARDIEVVGVGGRPGTPAVTLDARQSGTTSRFVLPLLGLVDGEVVLDGDPQLRGRPFEDLLGALGQLGVEVSGQGLPLTVRGRGGLRGGAVSVPADISSQFASGLLLVGPCCEQGLDLNLVGEVVSRPYLEMTVAVMTAFGAVVEQRPQGWRVHPGGYRGTRFGVEPDASTASYFLAAAAVTGGRVLVRGLSQQSLQGDVGFVEVLERMGANVTWTASGVEVRGPEVPPGRSGTPSGLIGVDVDLSQISDTAPTFAVVAALASGGSRARGIGFIRHKESDRVGGVVRELRRLGVDAEELPDGFAIRPGSLGGGVVQTYDDHRMAMAFAILGLVVPGVRIADPGCTAKTFPGFWTVLDGLRG